MFYCGNEGVSWHAPYDGHTLRDAVMQAERITGHKAKEIYVDRGYRGHNYEGGSGGACSAEREEEEGIAEEVVK